MTYIAAQSGWYVQFIAWIHQHRVSLRSNRAHVSFEFVTAITALASWWILVISCNALMLVQQQQ